VAKITPQQKIILQQLAKQQGYRDYKEMAEEIDINHKTYRAQLSRLEDAGMVKCEGENSPNWVITDEGMTMVEEGEAVISRADVGMTDKQIFENIGRRIGGLPPEKLQVISETIFTYNPEDLDMVWRLFCELGVSIDVRKPWFTGWRAHLQKAGKPVEISAAVQAQITPPDKRTPEQIKEFEAQGRDWIIEENEAGLPEILRMGPGVGIFTFSEATVALNLQNQARRRMSQANPPQFPQEPVSQLITALQPFLKKDEKDPDQSIVKWLIEEQLKPLTKSVADSQANKEPPSGMIEMLSKLADNVEKMKALAPILRAVLGVPETPVGQPAQQTPIQFQNPDGTPMVMNLTDFFTVQKFNAEQRREDDAAKGKQNFLKSIGGFAERIGRSVERSAGAK